MQQLSILISTTTEGGSLSKEEPASVPCKKNIKSGKLLTVDTIVSYHVTWPHKVYNIPLALFVND